MALNRTFAVGDIHGGLKALKQLLERIEKQDNDCFIFLGDYVVFTFEIYNDSYLLRKVGRHDILRKP